MSAQLCLTEANLEDYLRGLGIVAAGEHTEIEPAGDGNINWVRRVRVKPHDRTWIVKQARPALERFPEYQVSTDRILFEARYFETVRSLDLDPARVCPAVEAFDEEARVLVLEDLGDNRLDHALASGVDARGVARVLGGFLGRVHRGTRGAGLASRFRNDAMRRLHGDHIFHLPLRPNDFPLRPEVASRAAELQSDAALVGIVDAAYARYLEPRGALVHGDVQAGNILMSPRGPVLLDAEIAHVGDPAFDLASLLAHLMLPAVCRGEGAAARPAQVEAWAAYVAAHGEDGCVRFAEVARYAGIEMLRRTIGAARVADVDAVEASLGVIDVARRLICATPDTPDAIPG